MQSLRFNHVYFALLFFCAAIAFLLPHFVDPARAPAPVQNIFFPISRPTRVISQWLRHRVDPQSTPDLFAAGHPRSDDDIREENIEYHQMVANLTVQLQKLQDLESQRQAMGDLGQFCTPFKVTAGDAGTGTRQSLVISGSLIDGLKAKTAVVFPSVGLVGWLDPPGVIGTRVRLITDRGFAMTGIFKRFAKTPSGKPTVQILTREPILAKGAGANKLIMDLLQPAIANQIEVNDWLVLDDPDWQRAVQGELIGRVISRGPSHSSPGFFEVWIQPAKDLMRLSEVMVVTKAK